MHILAEAEFWVAVAFVIFLGVLWKVGAHRLLVGALSADAPYAKTIEPGFTPAIRDLVHRARQRS